MRSTFHDTTRLPLSSLKGLVSFLVPRCRFADASRHRPFFFWGTAGSTLGQGARSDLQLHGV
jgi:hypothetical protein